MSLTVTETIMFSTLQIVKLNKQHENIGSATGFAAAFCPNGNTFMPTLITNRHVLSNCDYIQVIFTVQKADGSPDIGNTVTATIDVNDRVFHPNDAIDLAALPLAPTILTLKSKGVTPFCPCISTDRIPTTEEWEKFDAIENVITTGFPEGLRDTVNNLPILRSGITATHPAYNFQGKPEFLVDMHCFRGGSGSPVYHVEKEDISNPKMVTNFFLLGIQHSMNVVSVSGELKGAPPELSNIKPVMQLPMSLGIIVKSSELLAFESIFNGLLNNAHST